MKDLFLIQRELKAPKDKYNTFGKYKYRSLEGILEALKPLLEKHDCGLYFNDEVVDRCGRTFLKTTVTFVDHNGNELHVTAEAEQSAQKSGMDAAQITGAASSYARKYAMNGLFLIDDTKDPDTDEFRQEQEAKSKKPRQQGFAPNSFAAPPKTQASEQPAAYNPSLVPSLMAQIPLIHDIAGLSQFKASCINYVNNNEEFKAALLAKYNELVSK